MATDFTFRRGFSHNAIEDALVPRRLWNNFWWLVICLSVSHGAINTPLYHAATWFNSEVAALGGLLRHSATCACAVFLAAPVVQHIGPKAGALLSMFLYCVSGLALLLAVALKCDDGNPSQSCWLFASVVAGVATGIFWTAQGSYVTLVAKEIGAMTYKPTCRVAPVLFGNFAWLHLVLGVACDVALAGMELYHAADWVICCVSCVVSFVTLFLMSFAIDIRKPEPEQPRHLLSSVFSAPLLWGDVVLWLLSPTNVLVGLCCVFMKEYVAGHFTADEISEHYVGSLAALTSLTAALLCPLFGNIASLMGNGLIFFFGGGLLLLIPISLLLTVQCLGDADCTTGWGWWLVILFLFQGVGRAVYETSSKAAFASFFDGPKMEAGFANSVLTSYLSYTIAQALPITATAGKSLEAAFTILAVLMMVTYPLAKIVHVRREVKARRQADSKSSDSGSQGSQGSQKTTPSTVEECGETEEVSSDPGTEPGTTV
eukprot:TRINITY_DN21522_c0_g1_i1.p1 TRINITY_DN21522_c0_g1~~TRINITY_DN21522_c0_g1_i1.p1  ORF type:complete len:487 (-),score=63.07 TRINITY_DN21522_c0_g1_i1:486-1946(-)